MPRGRRRKNPKLDPFKDANLRVSFVKACKDRINRSLDSLELPSSASDAKESLGVLQTQGCDANFVLQTSWLYAMLQDGLERNRAAEAGTRPEYRRLSFVGGSWTRQHVRMHVGKCRELADEIERFMGSARIPGEHLLDSAEVVMYFQALPGVLRRYAHFAARVGEKAVTVNEFAAQRARVLASLVEHIRAKTGRPHWTELLTLILAWRDEWPFEETFSESALRMQWTRFQESPAGLPLFRPNSTAQD